MNKLLMLLTMCIVGCANSTATENIDASLCLTVEEAAIIAQTEGRILKGYQYSFPSSPYANGHTTGCVKLSFKISKRGLATQIRVESAIPARVFNRSAIKALKKYKFDVPNMQPERNILILEFELKK
ncbi:MAG: TonB family protein [Algicola sp.]|nr:TonB family protein [Algicola sp.]